MRQGPAAWNSPNLLIRVCVRRIRWRNVEGDSPISAAQERLKNIARAGHRREGLERVWRDLLQHGEIYSRTDLAALVSSISAHKNKTVRRGYHARQAA